MPSKESTLTALLEAKGATPQRVWFEATFGYLPGGWFAEFLIGHRKRSLFEKSLGFTDPEEITVEISLGRTFDAAKFFIEGGAFADAFLQACQEEGETI